MRRYVRARDVLWRRASGAIVLLSPRAGDVFELHGTAVALWDTLADPATLDEAAAALAEQFGASVDAVATDVEAAVGDLLRRDVVEVIEAS